MDRCVDATPTPADRQDEDTEAAPAATGRRRFSVEGMAGRQAEDEDAQLERAVAHAKEGSGDAVRYLYCRYADMVYGYVRSIVADEHEAEDLTQTVFAKVMVRIGAYETRGLPFSHWLLRVARNTALDYLRRRRITPVAEVRVSDPVSDEGADRRRAATLREALARLPGHQRDVVLLRHVAGLSPSEIARRLNSTEAAVHGLHHRGRQALKVALAAQGVQPAVRRAL